MADLTDSETQDLLHEPLGSALNLKLPPPRPSDSPRAVPPPPAVQEIDRLLDHHRLKAALRADAELALATRAAQRRSGNPGVVERFVAVLGVWASTRQAVGLGEEARLAVGRALAWTQGDTCSSAYAYAVQRAVGILPGPDDVARVEHALAVHLVIPGSAEAVAGCLVQLADLAQAGGDGRRSRCHLEAALGLTGRAQPWQRFRVQDRLMRRLVVEERVDEAETLLDSIDPSAFPLPTRHAWLRARACVTAARGATRNPWRLQLDAVALATEVCGAEVLLEDLFTAAHFRARISDVLDAEDEGRLIEGTRRLGQAVKDDTQWITAVRRLARRLISGKPTKVDESEWLRRRLLQQHRQNVAQRFAPSDERNPSAAPSPSQTRRAV